MIQGLAILIIDELDKVSDAEAKARTADLLKNVSDNIPRVTIMLVGVAESLEDLVGAHPSIERNLVQIELPKMDDDYIEEIVRRGWAALGYTVDQGIEKLVAELANGFPHYAHLLGLCCAKACVSNETSHLTHDLFRVGCDLAIADAIEKYRSAYALATRTVKPSRYPGVLCACAYARHDDRGVFRATDVVEAMREVFKEQTSVPAVVPALGAFCTEDRGKVLTAVPVSGRNRYTLTDPMMRPFLRIKTGQLLRE